MSTLLIIIIYISFISLGLPDSILGSAWPIMYKDLNVPISNAGILLMIISVSTIISSFFSDKILKRLSAYKTTVLSVALTAVALFGFSFTKSFVILCLWSVPYGLGAGGVDSALNNYVALNYNSRQMNWLHCFWGLGATMGPLIMGFYLINGFEWPTGYKAIGIIQVSLLAILFLSYPLWKAKNSQRDDGVEHKSLSYKQKFKLNGAKNLYLAFFCYCAVETTVGLWAGSYLVLKMGVESNRAAAWVSFFFFGITIVRFLGGIVSNKIGDKLMNRYGIILVIVGCFLFLIPVEAVNLISLILIGCGCAPVFPSLLHLTPSVVGEQNSQGIMSMQISFAYLGSTLMPPVFGYLAENTSISLLPFFLLLFTLLAFISTERLKEQNLSSDKV